MGDEDSGLDAAESLDLTHVEEDASSPASGPRRIGNYRILQQLGEGGMGVVYEAEQERPVRRRVALKVIKLGMDTARVVARFQSERQALALMNHINIARVYDAGATAEGRPFFAMEYVQGIPITDYCARNRLGTSERLELFIQVCEGVQHAHQKGIIHRDIKPSNVLVGDQDGRRVPKIIDFGVAKATAQRLTEQTFFTEMGQLIGTPEYMSPEQAEMSGLDIDTRTDVYLLGVLLYELLTGQLPFDASQLREVGFNEYRRKVLEEEPPRPSTRVSSADRPAAARQRRPELALLARQLRGDLDWITMKALEKDRTRRYASASELAGEVRRFLGHEPVLAGPPSNTYKLGKFMRRHRPGVAAASVVVLALVLGVVGASYMYLSVREARDKEARAKGIAEKALEEKEKEAQTTKVVSTFLVEMFEKANPDNTRGGDITARELLDNGADRIAGELPGAPLVQARLMRTMADAYQGLGFGTRAIDLVESALRIQRDQLDAENLEVAETQAHLAELLIQTGEFRRARVLYQSCLSTMRNRLGEDAPEVYVKVNNFGSLVASMGDYEWAADLWDDLIASRERRDPDDPELAPTISNKAAMLWRKGDYEGARRGFIRARDLNLEKHGEASDKYAKSLDKLACLDQDEGRHDDARAGFETVLAIRTKLYDDKHKKIGETLMRMAILEWHGGSPEKGAALYRRALEILGKPDEMTSPFDLYGVASYFAVAGDKAEALRHLARAVIDLEWHGAPLESDHNLDSLRREPAFDAIRAAAGRAIMQRGVPNLAGGDPVTRGD